MKSKLGYFLIAIVLVICSMGVNTHNTFAQGNCYDQYEPNDSDNTATQLQSGRFQASICPANDEDVYKFSVSANESIYIQLTNLPEDFDISLYSVNKGDWVSESQNDKKADENIRWTASKSDTLYLFVYGYDKVTSSKQYTLNIYKGDLSSNLDYMRKKMKQNDFAKVMELLKYVVDSQKCISGLKTALVSGVVSVTTSCAGAATELSKVANAYINPGGAYGDRGDIGSLNLNAYCSYKYGSSTSAVMTNRQDAFSWGCYKNNQYVGGLDMEQVCKMQYPDLPHVTYNKRDAYSWQCIP